MGWQCWRLGGVDNGIERTFECNEKRGAHEAHPFSSSEFDLEAEARLQLDCSAAKCVAGDAEIGVEGSDRSVWIRRAQGVIDRLPFEIQFVEEVIGVHTELKAR